MTTTTTTTTQEVLRDRRARRASIGHPLSDRLLANVDDAPQPVRDSHETAVRAITDRIELKEKLHEAQARAESATLRDAEAYKAARRADKPPPESTEVEARAEADELRRRFSTARDYEAESLDRHAVAMAEHAAEWLPTREQVLRERAAAFAECPTLEAWVELDAAYVVVVFIHQLDPTEPSTLSLRKVWKLREPNFDPERALRRVLALAEQAPALATASEAGYERYAVGRAARSARAERKREWREQARTP